MKYLFIFLFFTIALNLCAQEKDIYISPDGNDQFEGTKEMPIATIRKAQSLIQNIKEQKRQGDTIFVFLREGIYRIKEGLLFDRAIGGTKDSPIIISGYKNERVIISGAVPINHYKPLSKDHFLYKMNPGIGSKILEIDLQKTGLSIFRPIRLAGFNGPRLPKPYALRELYFNGKPMPLSRWPNKGFSEFTDFVSELSDTDVRTGIVYEDLHISNWQNEPNILLHGYWKYLWADAYEQVSKIDTTNQVIWLNPPYNYHGFEKKHPFAAYNVIAEIDQPGEWAYDYQNKKIYFYPPEDMDGATLALSACETPLVTLNNTQWITFKNIRFEMSAGKGLQIINSSNITVDNCEVHGCARDGIIIDGGVDNTISACDLYDMGRGGIIVYGGNRETLEKSRFIIDNCHIHHLSRIDRTYTPGIWVDGVGTKITHCKIHDVPSSAMRINGNDHVIEYNEIYDVVRESDDQGAIDMWGDPTYRGNVFKFNYIHDVGSDEIKAPCGRAGIRFDDAISGNLVYGNIFRNCSDGRFGAIQIHGGQNNLIQNNMFIQCSAGISFSPWSSEHWVDFLKKSHDFLERNMEIYIAHYPELKRLEEDLNKNTVIQNIFLQCDSTTLRQPKEAIVKDNIETHENPELVDLERDNYSMKNYSKELKKIRFNPIPFEKIGLK